MLDMEDIRINIKKLGPINRCSFNYHPFTVVTGPGSTGKTLLLLSIYNVQMEMIQGFKEYFEEYSQVDSLRMTSASLEDYLSRQLKKLVSSYRGTDACDVHYTLGTPREFDINVHKDEDLWEVRINDYRQYVQDDLDETTALARVFSGYIQQFFFEEVFDQGGWYNFNDLPWSPTENKLSFTERINAFIKGSLFIDDTPHMCTLDGIDSMLHPEDQVDLLDFVLGKHRGGSHIVLSTNSDYILQRLNQCIRAGWLKNGDVSIYNNLLSEHPDLDDVYIIPQDVIHLRTQRKGNRVIVHNDYCGYNRDGKPTIHLTSFYKVVDDITNTEDDVNDSADYYLSTLEPPMWDIIE